MAKSIKLNNETYIDSSGIIHEKQTLDMIINKIINTSILGEFVLWEGNTLFSNTGAWQTLGDYYDLKQCIEMKFPIISGYKRTARICMECTDNKSSGGNYLKLENNEGYGGSYSKQYIFPYTWGAVTDGTRTFKSLEFSYDDLPTGHITMHITPDFAGGGQIRLYKIYLLISDDIE